MNEMVRLRVQAQFYKEFYPSGTRIELGHMNDPFAPVPAGTRGTVDRVDDIGQLHMTWDNGRTLAVVPGVDSFRKLTALELAAEQEGINLNKLKSYLEQEMIMEFESPEECMDFFNTYDHQDFKSVDEMKAYQAEYGFGLNGKWYHISYDDALDVREKPSVMDQIKSAGSRTGTPQAPANTNTKAQEPDR